MSKCANHATSSLNRAHALYISYTHWANDWTLDANDYLYVANSTGIDPTELDACWDDDCYPDGDEIMEPNTVTDD